MLDDLTGAKDCANTVNVRTATAGNTITYFENSLAVSIAVIACGKP